MPFTVVAKQVPSHLKVTQVGTYFDSYGEVFNVGADYHAKQTQQYCDVYVKFITLSGALRAIRASPILIEGYGTRIEMERRQLFRPKDSYQTRPVVQRIDVHSRLGPPNSNRRDEPQTSRQDNFQAGRRNNERHRHRVKPYTAESLDHELEEYHRQHRSRE